MNKIKVYLRGNVKFVSISRTTPRWCKVDYVMDRYMPTADLLWAYKKGSFGWDEYKRIFANTTLSNLNINSEVQILNEIMHPCDNIVLLCYEKDAEMCHRSLIANWFISNGVEVKEIRID